MFREMHDSGLPDPEYRAVDFITHAVVKNKLKKAAASYEVANEIPIIINENIPDIDLEKDLDKDLLNDLEKLCNINLSKNQKQITILIYKNKYITQKQLAILLGINERNIRVNVNKLKIKGIIQRIGPDKGGYWKVLFPI